MHDDCPILSWGALQANNAALAKELLKEWREYSVALWKALRGYSDERIEEAFAAKSTAWTQQHPHGTIAHYTGGPDGLLSALWLAFNTENDGSSCHGTFLQHRGSHHSVAEDLLTADFPTLRRMLPAAAVQHGNLDVGKWGATWTNGTCLQFEVESLGRVDARGHRRVRGRTYSASSYTQIGDAYWQGWRMGTLASWVNVHRAIAAANDRMFDRRWVLPHSAVQLAKSDAGAAFPITHVRELIAEPLLDDEDTAAVFYDMLRHPGVDNTNHAHRVHLSGWDALDVIDSMAEREARREAVIEKMIPRGGGRPLELSDLRRHLHQATLAIVSGALRLLGYATAADPLRTLLHGEAASDDLGVAVEVFQRASCASYRSTSATPWPRLVVDGVAGPKTLAVLLRKLRQMGFEASDEHGHVEALLAQHEA